jgi:hypothetical protein
VLGFLLLFPNLSSASDGFYWSPYQLDNDLCYVSKEDACNSSIGQPRVTSSSSIITWVSFSASNSNCHVRFDGATSGGYISNSYASCNTICDIETAQNFVDAANAESGGPVVNGPFSKPAGGMGIHVSIGYQVDNYCQFGCQMSHLVTQDVTEDEYYYQVTNSEQLYVTNTPCDPNQGFPSLSDSEAVQEYYVPPYIEWTSPPERPPITPPPEYPPNAPPPPPEAPPPPPDVPPPPTPPCIGNCEPAPPIVAPPAEPPIPPFVIVSPPPNWPSVPPAPPVPPSDPLPPNSPECLGNFCDGPPDGGCPEGTTFGSVNNLNGCYGEPNGQCPEGQYYGSVDGKNGCYGEQACPEGEVFGSVGDEEAKCFKEDSCYVKNKCNEECNPETETCDPLTGTLSTDCRVQPECGKADALECGILRQQWATMCRKGETFSGLPACGSEFKCENSPVECGMLEVHWLNKCALETDTFKNSLIEGFTSEGLTPVGEFTDDDIFVEHDGAAIIGDFLDADTRAGSCPPDLAIPIFTAVVVIPLTPLCDLAVYIRSLILLSASYFGLLIFYRSFINS